MKWNGLESADVLSNQVWHGRAVVAGGRADGTARQEGGDRASAQPPSGQQQGAGGGGVERREMAGLARQRSAPLTDGGCGGTCRDRRTRSTSQYVTSHHFPLAYLTSPYLTSPDLTLPHPTSQDALDVAAQHWGQPRDAAQAIVRAALGKGSGDNLTATVVFFGWQVGRR